MSERIARQLERERADVLAADLARSRAAQARAERDAAIARAEAEQARTVLGPPYWVGRPRPPWRPGPPFGAGVPPSRPPLYRPPASQVPPGSGEPVLPPRRIDGSPPSRGGIGQMRPPGPGGTAPTGPGRAPLPWEAALGS